MKTSYQKFMASSAVQSLEPTKIEMGEVKVELSLMDDAKKLLDQINQTARTGISQGGKAQEYAKLLNNAVQSIKKEYYKLEEDTIKASRIYGDAKKTFDSIGVDIKTTEIAQLLQNVERVSTTSRKQLAQVIVEIKNGIDNRL